MSAPPQDPAAAPLPRRLTARLRRLPARTLRRALLLVALVVAGGAIALTADLPDVATLRDWLADVGPLGWATLVAGLALATLAPVPRTALSLLAGVLAGFWGGLALALTSGVLGAAAGFLLARGLGREVVTRLAGPRLARADALLSERGFLAVLIGRLTPIVPFTVVSYAAGLSGMRWRDHLAGSALGLVPGTVLHVSIGATVGAAGRGGVPLLASLVPLTVALVVLGVATHRRRRTAGAGRPGA
ncbi:VTT domain-containing protein [Modestobacter sp. VKM Ac-2979]|uniref:TVP38/TMEM64 family protein n=1 Tax=unclassified Modestobacter TaxID=2643866 RepID=UPI0022AB5307|nr:MULTISPECIES: VTT domain-containing protein [unclassified Modestobacter]MCZ2811007.1 VTT domain-containing protein [Modestobacter sp. VKM Ac-2979]MCZ2840520.1 VTT domain-containing protein [Modestobacter sp. VKM Ac-2980]